jgi:hypothetical protein
MNRIPRGFGPIDPIGLPRPEPGPAKPITVQPVGIGRPTSPVAGTGTPSYKHGTDYVPKTGPAHLHKGEAVLNKDDADEYRNSKGKNMHSIYDAASHSLGGDHDKPAKEIKEIRTRKSKNGGYVHEHHHHSPEHHPMEEHTSSDQEGMVDHMMQHMGTPNEGEPEADAGQSGISASPQGANAAMSAAVGGS